MHILVKTFYQKKTKEKTSNLQRENFKRETSALQKGKIKKKI